ncbi:FAD-binding oxidoreductase [Bosea massiliensis]|uniref:FAD-binding oxidoreductase n=1 Tax=Bosea massiliensis TaxID=151419 RepID=A0ABW0P9Q9_9HYPH
MITAPTMAKVSDSGARHVGISDPGEQALSRFLTGLLGDGYAGEVAQDVASRLVSATDNSIYQVLPAAVLYPRGGEDINRIVRAARSDPQRPIALSPRGGGTGTNGQSLTRGVVVDVSRHLNRIVSLDVVGRTVVVEPGVVLDQLNEYLKPYGLFFPPTVSTATRATIGGMVATDASGKVRIPIHSGRVFRFEAGHRSDLMSATIPI